MKINCIRLLASAILSVSSVLAYAAPITISSYDATEIYAYGDCFDTSYTGVASPSAEYPTIVANYTGGSGWLNDGQISGAPGVNTDAEYIFFEFSYSVITLRLGEMAKISQIDFWSAMGLVPSQTLAGLDITINGETRHFDTVGFDWTSPEIEMTGDKYSQRRVHLEGSGLEELVTDTIIISGMTAIGGPKSLFVLSEINAYGLPSPAVVPEPAGLVLLAAGFTCLGLSRRRKYGVS